MTVEMIDGIRFLKLTDRAKRSALDSDTMTMVHLWRLLSGSNALRDTAIGTRRFL